MLISVVLPAPFGPSSAKISPGRISRETFVSACWPLAYVFDETNAVKLAFGDHAKRMVVNSTKSMTGHLLGGAGGIESVFTVLALHHQVSPPTINIFNQDPQCDLDYCANTAREMKIDVAVKNNFGFGGTNGTLVFRRA
jgi:3-oxoacyl-[acyl-carrier-protein] synthase II